MTPLYLEIQVRSDNPVEKIVLEEVRALLKNFTLLQPGNRTITVKANHLPLCNASNDISYVRTLITLLTDVNILMCEVSPTKYGYVVDLELKN